MDSVKLFPASRGGEMFKLCFSPENRFTSAGSVGTLDCSGFCPLSCRGDDLFHCSPSACAFNKRD